MQGHNLAVTIIIPDNIEEEKEAVLKKLPARVQAMDLVKLVEAVREYGDIKTRETF